MPKFVLFLSVLFSISSFADSPPPSASTPDAPEEHMTETRYVVSGILGVYPGFGIGHAVQGRYAAKGWVFTAGELGSALVLLTGLENCAYHNATYAYDHGGCNNGLFNLGVIAFLGFRIWEIVDIWSVPVKHNLIIGRTPPPKPQLLLGVIPAQHERPTLFALNLRF